MFIAGIETDDGIYREWILSRLAKSRAKQALQQTIELQTTSGKRLRVNEIKNLLWEGETNGVYNTTIGQTSAFLGVITQ